MPTDFIQHLQKQLAETRAAGLYKEERIIISPQQAQITLSNQQKVINFCANNYLGLADDPQIIETAKESYAHYGFGLASVRFICGTQDIHKKLEKRLAQFLGMEDCILYSSCFDANGGIFEAFLGPEDAVISDALNHASLIDGIRLCKAQRLRYQHNDMADLEKQLQASQQARFRLIVTDGVFSMDGTIANLKVICELAERYHALTLIDDCHAVGFLGANGRGTHEHCDVMHKIDIITGTLGKALGGASGGYIASKKEIVDWLRQRSRPYLFSNTVAPAIVAASLKVMDLIENGQERRQRLHANSCYFREKMTKLGFKLIPGEHPIIPILLGEARLAQDFAAKMLEYGIYVIGFSYPVVPQGQARIRTQMSAAHTIADLNQAIEAFGKVGHELKIL